MYYLFDSAVIFEQYSTETKHFSLKLPIFGISADIDLNRRHELLYIQFLPVKVPFDGINMGPKSRPAAAPFGTTTFNKFGPFEIQVYP